MLRNAHCPVLLLKRESIAPVQRVLIAVNPKVEDPRHQQLIEDIIYVGKQITEDREGSELHAVCAYTGAESVTHPPELAKLVGIDESRAHCSSGSSDDVIVECAKSLESELVVVGTVSRTGLDGVTRGNTAERALFESYCPAPEGLGVQRYLPRHALRLLVNQRGIDMTKQLHLDDYSGLLENIDRDVAMQMIDMTRATLKTQVQQIEGVAARQLPEIRSASIASMHRELDSELQRLISLKKRNPTIRDEEIQQLEININDLETRLSGSTLNISALRVIYTH